MAKSKKVLNVKMMDELVFAELGCHLEINVSQKVYDLRWVRDTQIAFLYDTGDYSRSELAIIFGCHRSTIDKAVL